MGIPYHAIGSTPRRASEADRDRTAIELASFLRLTLELDLGNIDTYLRAEFMRRADAVYRAQGLPHASTGDRSHSTVDEAKAHLGAALVQSVASDDQIIIDHVRKAHALLGGRL